MKKIIVIATIIFSVFLKNTYAETIYGEYKKVDEFSKRFEDEIKIDSYKIYNTYTKEYIDMGYMRDNELYIKDENDYIIEETLTNEYKASDEYITINFDYLCKVRTLFLLTDIKDLELTELEVFYKGEKINYTIENITDDKINYLYDNNLDTIYKHNSSTYISLAFDKGLFLKDTKIVMHTKKGINSSFTLFMGHSPIITLNNTSDKKHIITFNIVYEEIEKKIEYFYIDEIKLYKHYEEIKNVKNMYLREGDNLLLDDYKIINEYYERDKLVLKDNLIINNKNQTVKDLIEYASDELKVECDINYQINDKYNCRFILNDIDIKKDVIVNIKENEKIESNIKYETNKETEKQKDYEINKDNNIKIENIGETKEIIIQETKKEAVLENKQNIKKENNEVLKFKSKKTNKKDTSNKIQIESKKNNQKFINVENNNKKENINNSKKNNFKNKKIIKLTIVSLLILLNIFIIKKEKEILSKLFKKNNK